MLLLFKIMKKRIKSYHKTKVSRDEVMTGNSSSAMTNAPPVTMQRGIRLVNVKHAAETTQAFPALHPASARAPADATASGSSCEQLQTAIRHCFPVTSTAEGVPRSNLMIFIFAFLPLQTPSGSGSGSGLRCLLSHQRVQLKGTVEVEFTRKTQPVATTTPAFLPPRWTLSAIFFCCAAKLYLATSASHACL